MQITHVLEIQSIQSKHRA